MTTTLLILAIALLWAETTVWGYRLYRFYWRAEFNEWRCRDRRFALTFAILLGPIWLMAGVLVAFVDVFLLEWRIFRYQYPPA